MATQADGNALPGWLTFDAATGTFDGTPPAGMSEIEVKVVARDQFGHEAVQIFKLGVKQADRHGALHDGHQLIHLTSLRDVFASKGKPGISQQIRHASRSHQLAQHAALLRTADQIIRQNRI
jgi:hypothetical protein